MTHPTGREARSDYVKPATAPFIAPARSSADIAHFRRLCREYAASLPCIAESLGHQGFDREMDSLPGVYRPPAGEILLAFPAEDPSHASGCVALRPLDEPGVCEMKRMYINPAARGAGLGHLLANAIVDHARCAGYRLMKLDTDRSFAAAIAVYRRLGFVECPPYNTDPCPDTLWFQRDL
jgi:GNAT superfamily N-acetyltransferase